jgi:NADH dehydrogenase
LCHSVLRVNENILILGGGFAGVAVARRLEKLLGKRRDITITLVNRENYSLFTPMLSEVAGGGIEPSHVVNPVRAFLRRTSFREGTVQSIDLVQKHVEINHPEAHEPTTLSYDRLVLALGAVTNFHSVPGAEENAFSLKSISDGQAIRDHILSLLEEASQIADPAGRECLLRFVIAGGGFSGAELCGALDDFISRALRYYPGIRPGEIHFVLVEHGARLLPEVGPELAEYARQNLARRGIDVRLSCGVSQATDHSVTLSSGDELACHTLIWTAGTAPAPVIRGLACTLDGRGAVVVDSKLEVPNFPGVFALGDCASISDPRNGKHYPPTAQHALREAETAARNVAASLGMGRARPFVYDAFGSLAVLGRRTAVAELKGLRFSGFLAWWLWRTVYWTKLPGIERRIRVSVDWTLDLLFPADTAQLGSGQSHFHPRLAPAHAPESVSIPRPPDAPVATDRDTPAVPVHPSLELGVTPEPS